MVIKVNIKKNIPDKLIKNYVFFTDKDFKIHGLKDLSLGKDTQLIKSSINSDSSAKKNFLHFNLRPNLKITLIKINNSKDTIDNEKIGAKFYDFIKSNSIFFLTFHEKNITRSQRSNKSFFDEFLHGVNLKSYIFDKYKTKKDRNVYKIDILAKKSFRLNQDKRFNSLLEGVKFTKDLVSEPGNILHPDEYAKD